MLKELPINYTGFIEGSDIFAGKADVAVCDGFSGNLILKSGEGLARMFFQHIEYGEEKTVGWQNWVPCLLEKSLQDTLERFEPSKHNGAPLLGTSGCGGEKPRKCGPRGPWSCNQGSSCGSRASGSAIN